MRANLEGRQGLVYALAQAKKKSLCAEALAQDKNLVSLITRDYPDIDRESAASAAAQLGDAPEQARRFVAVVQKL